MATGNISYKTLMQLHQIYLDNKRKILSGDTKFGETKTIWFGLEDGMREFLTAALNNKEVDGLRFYIFQYPGEQTEIDGQLYPASPDNVNQLSIGIVTTKSLQGSTVNAAGGDDEEEAYNHGEMCPTICPPPPPPPGAND